MHGFRAKENGQARKVEIWELWVYKVLNMNDVSQETRVEWKENMYEDRALGDTWREVKDNGNRVIWEGIVSIIDWEGASQAKGENLYSF